MAITSEKYSKEELETILSEFKIVPMEYSFMYMTEGFINDTFLVSDTKQPMYILQRVNHNVFENIEGLMTNITRALKQLKATDYKRIQLLPAKSGKVYISVSSGYWRVMTFLTNSTTYTTTVESNIAFEAGRIIGKFHLLLANEKLDYYTDTIPKFHDLDLRKMQFLAAKARASQEKKEVARKAIVFGQKMFAELQMMEIEHLPLRVCHNDTKLNNILFSTKTQKALCLIDLDTIMPGHFHFDFGDAIRTIVNTASEDEQDHTQITFKKTLFEAFIDGLASNGSFLSKKEIGALSYGVILMPFLHGLRALTDFLNNNIYYKVTYENQNLDRCLSLFDYTRKAFTNVTYMNSILSEKL